VPRESSPSAQRFWTRLLPGFICIVLTAFTQTGSAQQIIQVASDTEPQNEFLLRTSAESVDAIAARYGLTIIRSVGTAPYDIFLVRGPAPSSTTSAAEASEALVNQVGSDPEVLDIEPNATVVAPEVPAGVRLDLAPVSILDALNNRSIVEFFGDQVWNRYTSQPAATAIRLSTSPSRVTGAGVIVAVIDTGVDPNHPILAGSLVPGYDFVNDSAGTASEWTGVDPSIGTILDLAPVSILDQVSPVTLNPSTLAILNETQASALASTPLPAAFGHGTMVAGLVHLVAPGARIMPLKAFRADGTSNVFDIVRAIHYAVENGARVINMSFSMAAMSPEVTQAINMATSRGVICVSSAGNFGRETIVYPGGQRNVLGIGSTNSASPAARSSFSNYGDALVSLAAPGEAVITTYPGGGYAGAWGTSFSTPLVAGAAALIVQVDASVDHADVFNILSKAESMPLSGLGRGRLNLYETMRRVSDNTPPVVSFTGPASGAVSGSVSVSVSATDNLRVAAVRFRVNGQSLGSTDTQAPYQVTWNTSTLPNGVHVLTAVAEDDEENQATATLTVTVTNDSGAPTVAITSPSGSVNGGVTVTASASDDMGVTGVQFMLDGSPLGAEDVEAPYETAWDTLGSPNGAHVLTAVARDAAGRTATAASVTVTVGNDATAPVVGITSPGGILAGGMLAGSVTVAATASDDVGVAGVQFMLDGAPLGAEDVAAPYEVIWNTAAGTNGVHVLSAIARDGAGRLTTAGDVSVAVLNDLTAPVVAITTPGGSLAGTVSVAASASDDMGVLGVQFLLDGAPLGPEDSSAPYQVAWDTTGAANGAHALTAIARDAAGRTSTAAAVSVSVANDVAGPVVSMVSPGSSVTGSITISATASDDFGVVGVQFLLDGAPLGSEDTTEPYELTWDSATVPNGAHMLAAVARDAVGHSSTAAAVSVTTSNDLAAPTVAVTTAAGTVSGSITVSATASDDIAVAGVQFMIDGTPLGAEDVEAPYEAAWSTTSAPNGAHVLTAVTRDASGKTTTSAPVSVTVSNDLAAPVVALSTAGGNVTGSVSVAATASDDIGVAGVQFLLDGAPLGAEDTTAPYETAWDSATAANGVHALTAIARDASGKTTSSAAVSVTVSNDLAAPVVALSTAGGNISGSVSVAATASDDIGVAGVQFLLDGAPLGAEDTTAPYEASWDSATVANGDHTLSAVARDASGKATTSAAITVAVSNDLAAPTVALAGAGGIVSGSTTVAATASDDIGVVGVQFLLDGAPLGPEDTVAPYESAWDSAAAANGAHVLTAVARDASGKTTTSAALSVTVANDLAAPTIVLANPGAVLAGSLSLSATASDDIGVVGVQFLLDGAPLGVEVTTGSFEMTWDTTTVGDGVHVLSAIARDAAGRTTTAAAVSVTVTNVGAPGSPSSVQPDVQ
jgi:subtilisin family serine protease